MERMAHPDAALAIASADDAIRDRGWKTLQTSTISMSDAADLGELEPSARRRG
jgi:hypothetical protein